MTDKINLFPKKETAFIKEFMDVFQKECFKTYRYWHFKTHGEPMQVRGLPDILMCFGGLFVALEFKIMRSGHLAVTPLQDWTMGEINDAGGTSMVVWYDAANKNVGIGSERFDNKKDAVLHLIAVIEPMAKIIKDVREKLKNIDGGNFEIVRFPVKVSDNSVGIA